jgi:hypothetical protein
VLCSAALLLFGDSFAWSFGDHLNAKAQRRGSCSTPHRAASARKEASVHSAHGQQSTDGRPLSACTVQCALGRGEEPPG